MAAKAKQANPRTKKAAGKKRLAQVAGRQGKAVKKATKKPTRKSDKKLDKKLDNKSVKKLGNKSDNKSVKKAANKTSKKAAKKSTDKKSAGKKSPKKSSLGASGQEVLFEDFSAPKRKAPNDNGAGAVSSVSFVEALKERYITYALSTITARSLPDVRDGLKPVHRRLLYAMLRLRLRDDEPFRKSARVVGDVIGRFHPHGEVAVYDALVRLAQDFSMRLPLIEGQGNFGAIDGDSAAAMRYTEARLSPAGRLLMEGLDEDTVDFRETYDASEREPVVMPAGFPNLLANGAQGIAVGMSCSIPPHNLVELCRALRHLLKSPKARHGSLMEFIPGPDFPTGGVIVESPETLSEIYKSGRGQIRLRARWHEESKSRGTSRIIVDEIPYQVPKARLIARLAELLDEKKIANFKGLQDESGETVRIVLNLGGENPQETMEALFRASDLESRIQVNLNALTAEGAPHRFSLGELLLAYLDHRFVVIRRRAKFRLERTEERLELVEGFLALFKNLEAAIRIIRKEENPVAALMKKFRLSERQAEAVLNLRLRALRRLEETRLREEHKSLLADKRTYGALLRDKEKQRQKIHEELKELESRFSSKTELGRRRTDFGEPPAATATVRPTVEEALAPVRGERIAIVLSAKDWIRATQGAMPAPDAIKFRDGDSLSLTASARSSSRLAVLGSNGRCYPLEAERLPSMRGYGESLRLLTGLPSEARPVAILPLVAGGRAIIAASDGRGFVVPHEALHTRLKGGIQVLNLRDGVEATAGAVLAEGDDTLACASSDKRLLLLPLDELPVLKRGRGVILQKQKSDTKLLAVAGLAQGQGLTWVTPKGKKHRLTDCEKWLGKRAQSGRRFPRNLSVEALRLAHATEDSLEEQEDA